MNIRKHGGLVFWRIGRIGGTFHIAKRPARTWDGAKARAENVGLVSVAIVALATLMGG